MSVATMVRALKSLRTEAGGRVSMDGEDFEKLRIAAAQNNAGVEIVMSLLDEWIAESKNKTRRWALECFRDSARAAITANKDAR